MVAEAASPERTPSILVVIRGAAGEEGIANEVWMGDERALAKWRRIVAEVALRVV